MLLIGLWIWLIVWVYRDAESRGMNGVLWALLVLFGNFIGLLIYLIVRSDALPSSTPRIESRLCPTCEKNIAETYAFCPYCGNKMETTCPECMKPVEPGWKVCPQCGAKLQTNHEDE
jgi:predicted amidophosphoribosyltransferase